MMKLLFAFFVLISSGMLQSSAFAYEKNYGWDDMGKDFEGVNHYYQKGMIDSDGHLTIVHKEGKYGDELQGWFDCAKGLVGWSGGDQWYVITEDSMNAIAFRRYCR